MGSVLYQHLSDLKYPKITKFSPSSFDWLFDNEESTPFLNWFCSSVTCSKNLLSPTELDKSFQYSPFNRYQSINSICFFYFSRFQSLQNGGVTVLEGLRLSQAVEFRPKETNRGVLLTEIEELELAKEKLIKQKQTYVSKLNVLKYFFINSTIHFILVYSKFVF